MATGKRATKKVQPVLGGFEKSNYVTERLWARAPDGTKVIFSLTSTAWDALSFPISLIAWIWISISGIEAVLS